jgi:hypothetical protein
MSARGCVLHLEQGQFFVGIFSIVRCGTSQICIRLSMIKARYGIWDLGIEGLESYIKQPQSPPFARQGHQTQSPPTYLPLVLARFIYTIIMGWFDDNHDYTQNYNDVCFSFCPFATSAVATFIVIVFSTKVAPSTSRVSPTRSLPVLRPMRFVPVAPKFSCNIQNTS